MIELRGVTKSYGERAAVHDLTLTAENGKVTVLIGPSGCGKSTVLRLIAGLVRPESGSVTVGGKEVTPETEMEVRRSLGYVIQDGGLFPHLTARQNVTFMARHLNWDESRVTSRLSELSDLTHFPLDGLDRYPTELSGGQRQRVALMRGLMLDPQVLLLDEPLGALDPLVRSSLQTDLRDIFSKLGKTVLFVTHDLAEAAYIGDRIILMRDGRIVQQGTIDDFRGAPADPFVTDFVTAQRSFVAL